MSSYFDEEDLGLEQQEVYKGIRFCPECGALMHPKHDHGKLGLECFTCGHQETVENSTSAAENLVSRKEFQKEKNVIIDADFALDPTMPRESKECPSCGHKEAVFFISSDIEDTKIVLVYICNKCGHYWRKEVDDEED
jgi:DNA-directed RNA polymerase II subunit RPB9